MLISIRNQLIIGINVHTAEKKPESLLVASKNIFFEVSADKTKYMFMSLDQNARRSHYVQIHDCSFERVEKF
jgi:hypothetical protein